MNEAELRAFMEMVTTQLFRVEENRQSQLVVGLTVLSLMLDKGVVSLDEVTVRLEAVRHAMGAGYQTEEVKSRVKFFADVLRKEHGAKQLAWTPEIIQGGLNQDQTPDPDQAK